MDAENVDFFNSDAYITANDLVDGLLIREESNDKSKKPLYLFLAKEIFTDLNLSIIRQTERYLLKVDKRLNCINAPDGYKEFSSISVPNEKGLFNPLIYNPNIPTDVVDLGASTACGCDCGCTCGYCGTIKHYETITSIIPAAMPDGTLVDFAGTVRKKIYQDGRYVRETTVPTQVFKNNIHTDTVLQTTTEELCKLEVKECGCVIPNQANERMLFACCDSTSIANDCGCPVRELPVDAKYYKINDKGNRIHFPADFPYDTVLLRFYSDRKTKDLRIPYLAAKAMRSGIKAEQTTYNSPGSKENLFWIAKYASDKEKLAGDLTKLKLSAFLTHVVGIFDVL